MFEGVLEGGEGDVSVEKRKKGRKEGEERESKNKEDGGEPLRKEG